MEENQTDSLIVQRANGSYMRLKQVVVHADYVNEDGSPRVNENGEADNGNYAIMLTEKQLSLFPKETIQMLAHIYDAIPE